MDLTRSCTTSPPPKLTKTADFVFYRGTTFRATFTFKDSADAPINLSGINIVFYIVELDGDEILTIGTNIPASPNGSTVNIIDSPNGKVEVLVTDEETATFDFDSALWWISLNLANGDIVPRGKGEITIKEPYE